MVLLPIDIEAAILLTYHTDYPLLFQHPNPQLSLKVGNGNQLNTLREISERFILQR